MNRVVSVFEANDGIAGFFIHDTKCVEHYDWLLFNLAEDVLWGTDVWVAPSQRGKNLQGHMRSFNLSRLSREGYQRALGTVVAQNVPALRASLKMTNIACAYTYFRLFKLTLVWIDGRLRVGFWRPGHRFVVHSDELHSVPGQKFGRHKARKLERHIYKRDS